MPAKKNKGWSSAVVSHRIARTPAFDAAASPSRGESPAKLRDIRRSIDDIDGLLVRLLAERMELALQAGKLKARPADAAREDEVLRNILRRSRGPLAEGFLQDLFQRIIAECRTAEEARPSLIGFQGEHGAYSEEAARALLPESVPVPLRGFREVFDGVASGALDFGVVPVENSTEGAVVEVNDLLLEFDLFVIRAVRFPVHHHLLVPPGAENQGVRSVWSHPQALAQCRRFLQSRRLEARPVYDTAGAARLLAAEPRSGTAVIASRLCADLYHLDVAEENIEDEPTNRTRFLVLSRKAHSGRASKGSIAFSTRHEAGALCDVLEAFRAFGINLQRIESRPVKSDPGTYVFFVDFTGSPEEAAVALALETARQKTTFWKFLGWYEEA